MPKSTPIRLGLYVTDKRERDWYHVHATAVTIGPTRWEMQQVDEGTPHNVPHDRIRNCGRYDECGPLDLDSLTVTSQGDDHPAETRRLYGWDVEYRNIYSVDARRAERMHKTLSTITRRMERTADKYGRPATFGAFLARVAEAIGADAIVLPNDRRASSYDDRTHRILSIADGIYAVDRMIDAWANPQTETDARTA